jgi:hypothetical protein
MPLHSDDFDLSWSPSESLWHVYREGKLVESFDTFAEACAFIEATIGEANDDA